ncbi:type VII secretion integral membrane protein EccD [Streptomyces sp. NPDC050504]|uniref:type VII secretion integral membrane protein EccD n=1 Tax=Streptomyces sp. NPDC050504 TaxID=3365618 RepID=UPI00378EF7FB
MGGPQALGCREIRTQSRTAVRAADFRPPRDGFHERERQVSTSTRPTGAVSGQDGSAAPSVNGPAEGHPAGPGTAPGAGPGTVRPAARGTGFCRVTVVAPDSRVDVALPEDVPLADLQPEILRLSGQVQDRGAPVGYHLVRRDGSVLDSARTLAAQRIPDGELLSLRPFAESLPPAVFDDVSDAVASVVARDRTFWSAALTRAAGLFGASALLVLLALVLWSAAPGHDTHGLPGVLAAVTAVLLVTLSAVRARVYDDGAASLALGAAAFAHAAVAGSGLLPLGAGQGVGRLQALLACAAVLIAALVLTIAAPGGDGPFVAFAAAAATGVLALFTASTAGLEPVEAAAMCSPVAVGALAFLPGLATRFARLPVGFDAPRTTLIDHGDTSDERQGSHASESRRPYASEPGGPYASGLQGSYGPGSQGPYDPERIAAQAARGHELLVGLVGGCALVAVGAAAVLGFSGDPWGQLLALATGIALLTRAHLFRYAAQVAGALAGGLGVLLLLGLGLALNPPRGPLREALAGDTAALDLRTTWLAAAVAATAAVLAAIALIVPRKGVTPFWGRVLELVEAAVLLTLLPLVLAVFDVYRAIRVMTS